MRWFRRGQDEAKAQDEFESHQERLSRLTGEVLSRYQREMNSKISEPGRLAEVYGTEFASADFRRQAQGICNLAASILNVPNAMINVVTADKQETVATYGQFSLGTSSVEDSYCKNVIGTGREFAVSDAHDHALVCDTSWAREGSLISYLGVPIVKNDWIVGVLCVFDDEPRDWGVADVGILTQLSAVLSRAIAAGAATPAG